MPQEGNVEREALYLVGQEQKLPGISIRLVFLTQNLF